MPKGLDSRALSVEMLGAGINPNARVTNYSSLANNPGLLMKTKFKKPPLASTRFPPVLDMYSRTMAAPMNSSRTYIAPSVRIASYYNPEARKLIIDSDRRGIRIVAEEQKKNLVANINPLIPQVATN